MLFILILTLWYQDGTYFASANAYPTQAQCEHMRDSATSGIQEGAIAGVAAVDAMCFPVSNPATALNP